MLEFFCLSRQFDTIRAITPSSGQSSKAETLDAKRWFEANQHVLPIGEEAMKMAINFREIQPNWQTAARHGRGIEVDFVSGNKKIFPQNKQEGGKQGRVHLLLMKSGDKGYVPYLIYYLPSKDFVGNIDKIHYGNYLKGAYKGDVVYNRIGATNFRCLRIESTKIVRTGLGKMPNPNKPEGSCFTGWLCFSIQVWDSNKNEWVTVLGSCEPGYEWCDDCDPGNVDSKPEYCYQPCDISNPDRPVYCDIDCDPSNSTQPAYCTDECDMSNPNRPPTCDGGNECAGPYPPIYCTGNDELSTCADNFSFSSASSISMKQEAGISGLSYKLSNTFTLNIGTYYFSAPFHDVNHNLIYTPEDAATTAANACNYAEGIVRGYYINHPTASVSELTNLWEAKVERYFTTDGHPDTIIGYADFLVSPNQINLGHTPIVKPYEPCD